MKYLLLAQFDDGSEEYWPFDKLKDAEDKMDNLKRYAYQNAEHLFIVETKMISHWANTNVSSEQ